MALGGNDALRGLPVEELERNLPPIIERAQARRITVILAGMEAPPNFGADYTVAFHQVYPRPGRRSTTWSLVPFLLEGVAGDRALNQRDGIHPTAEAARIAGRDRLERACEPLVEQREGVADDRAARRVQDRHERHRAADHPSSADDRPFRAASSSRSSAPSGSGKSTLLGLIAGLDAPTSGSVLIDGVDITRLDEDALAKLRGEKIGFVFQFFHLIPSLTALRERRRADGDRRRCRTPPRAPDGCSRRWA